MAFNETMRRALRPAAENGLTASERHVLIELCNLAGKTGRLWHSHEKIAANCGVSRATVIRATKTLEALGWMVRERRRRKDGTRSSDVIRVSAPAIASTPPRLLPLMTTVGGTDGIKVAPCNPVKVAPCNPATRQQSRTVQQQNPIKDSNLDPLANDSAVVERSKRTDVDPMVAEGFRELMGRLGTRRRAG